MFVVVNVLAIKELRIYYHVNFGLLFLAICVSFVSAPWPGINQTLFFVDIDREYENSSLLCCPNFQFRDNNAELAL